MPNNLFLLAAGSAVVLFILNLGLFATKAELSALDGNIAKYYVNKIDLDKRLDKIDAKLERLLEQGSK